MSDITDLSLAELARAIRARKIGAVEATKASCRRIEALRPKLNCFIAFDPEPALKAAKKVDAALPKRKKLGPLAGVPLAHKDMYYRKGRIATCGSGQRKDWVAGATATALARLDAAGALDLGTLNMAEFAYGPTGHNAHFGHCRNPWDPARITGGSSSGSASAVGARLVSAALGSDTGGSIRLPAHLCGLSGLKPTTGRVSRAGAMPLSYSLDTVGPLARTVEDCALMLQVLAGPDPADPTASTRAVPNYLSACRKPAKGLRIGVPRRFFWDDMDKAIGRTLENALAVFRGLGCRVVEIEVSDMDRVTAAANVMLGAEASTLHRRWMLESPERYGAQISARLETGLTYTAVQYIDAQRYRGPALREFLASIDKVDLVFLPTYDKPTPTIAETDVGGSPAAPLVIAALTRLCRPINYLGLPALSVQAGMANGLPVGFQLVGRAFDEATLFQAGAAIQRATDWHKQAPRTG